MLTRNIAPINIMVADNSLIMRNLFKRALDKEVALELVALVSNGHQAITEIRKNPKIEVALLDIEMPLIDGLQAIPILLKEKPKLKIIIVSSLAVAGEQRTIEALAAGAIDYIEKPSNSNDLEKFFKELFLKIKIIITDKQIESSTSFLNIKKGEIVLRKTPNFFHPEIIAVASSTGGPQALLELFKRFSQDYLNQRFIFITQHIKKDFVKLLVNSLNSLGNVVSKEAEDGEEVNKGIVYIAPADFHLEIKNKAGKLCIHLSNKAPENFCRPSADPMFRSLTRISNNILAIILTGIGSDGARGGLEIANNNGIVVVQDEETSVVWGMPGSAVSLGICSAILPLNQIATYVEKNFL